MMYIRRHKGCNTVLESKVNNPIYKNNANQEVEKPVRFEANLDQLPTKKLWYYIISM